MPVVLPCELPQTSLLRKYEQGLGYTDCYVTEVVRPISQAAFVEAFYTTWLFRIERVILKLARRPSSDAEARQLSVGAIPTFAAWRVEAQTPEQLLLADFTGRTRSWLMAVASSDPAADTSTRLYFGSAVVPTRSKPSAPPTLGFPFHALLGFHRLYSKLLLGAARSRLLQSGATR